MSSPFHFHYNKAAQAVASLLRSEPGQRMNYYRLLKLLYIADRQSIEETGRPIIGGRLIAMDRGPLHSAGFDLVQGKDSEIAWWSQFFRTERYDLEMVQDPGNGDLSAREIDVLNRVRNQHEMDDDFEVGKQTHTFPEFIKNQAPPEKSKTIPFTDLLEAVGRGQDAELIMKDAAEMALFDRVFGT
jgi:uncharacterized phage-associated protein